MNKINKIALLVAATFSAGAFASDAGKFDVEVYGKVGVAAQLDADTEGHLTPVTGEDFDAYEDSKIGIKVGYGINKNFSVHTEIQGRFEGKEEEVVVQELFVKGDFGMMDFEAGRFRTPLYMNSVNQDDDFNLNTYRGVRGFSTSQSALENVDGVSVGFNHKLGMMDFEVRALAGQAKDRDHGFWDGNDTDTYRTTAENVFGGEMNFGSKFGDVRVAYLESEVEAEYAGVMVERYDFDSTSVGYSLQLESLFVEAEVAFENNDDIETNKGYATVGYAVGDFVPSVTYSEVDVDDFEKLQSLEMNLAYNINKNLKVKGAFEMVEQGEFEDDVVSLGVAFKF